MVRVGVEPGAGACACRGSTLTGETPPLEPRGAVTPPATFAPRDHGVDRRIAGVEELADVDARRSRAKPARLVRLVPHQPLRHPAVARGGGPGEAGERRTLPERSSSPGRRSPSRRPDDPDHGGDAAAAQAVEDCVAVLPGVLAARRLDLVPVQVEAHDVDAELLEPVEPLVERAAAVGEPGVVLDPEADVSARRQPWVRRARSARRHKRRRGKDAFRAASRRYPFRHIRILLTSAASRSSAPSPPAPSARRRTRRRARRRMQRRSASGSAAPVSWVRWYRGG